MVSKAPQFDALPLEPTLAARCGLQVIGAPTSAAAAQQGNQGTALVVRKVTSFPSDYSAAPSHKPSSCNAAYFRCVPRELVPHSPGRVRLQIKVFERHPFTRQAFIPMGRKSKCRAYVVIVTEDKDGRPDLDKVQAFVAMGDQGVVYAENQWHSPMCAIDKTVEFAVIQNENGVPEEDTVEYYLKDDERVEIILEKADLNLNYAINTVSLPLYPKEKFEAVLTPKEDLSRQHRLRF